MFVSVWGIGRVDASRRECERAVVRSSRVSRARGADGDSIVRTRVRPTVRSFVRRHGVADASRVRDDGGGTARVRARVGSRARDDDEDDDEDGARGAREGRVEG